MASIKIEDLPVIEDVSEKESKGIFGGQELRRRSPSPTQGRFRKSGSPFLGLGQRRRPPLRGVGPTGFPTEGIIL